MFGEICSYPLCCCLYHILPFHSVSDAELISTFAEDHAINVDPNQMHVSFNTVGYDKYMCKSCHANNLLSELDACNFLKCKFLPLKDVTKPSDSVVSLVHLNICSLPVHINELEIVASELHSPPIIGLCKT